MLILLRQDLQIRANKYSKKTNLIAFLNSYSEGLSGSDLRFIEISKRIMRNVALIVVTSKLGNDLCEKRGLNAKFFLTSKENNFGNVFIIYVMRMLAAIFLRLEIDNNAIVYATSDFLPDVLPAYVLKFKKQVKWVQVIHHIQEKPFDRVGKSWFVNMFGFISQRLSFALIKKRADLIIVVNPITREQLLKEAFNGKKVCINYNGVNLNKVRDFMPSNKKYDCVFLGRLNVSKGIFDLLKVWSDIVAKKPSAKLAIIGKGESQIEKRLRNDVSRMKLQKNIDFCGYLDDSEAFGILKSAKVFLFPSYEEGFGIAILQAMACGLPVVAYNLPVYRGVFDDKLISVPLGRTDIMSQRAWFLLEHPEDAKLLSKAGMAIVKKYDWDKIAERELLLIESI